MVLVLSVVLFVLSVVVVVVFLAPFLPFLVLVLVVAVESVEVLVSFFVVASWVVANVNGTNSIPTNNNVASFFIFFPPYRWGSFRPPFAYQYDASVEWSQ